MKEIAEKANQLVVESRMVADNLNAYNPGLDRDKIPLATIQYDIASMIQWYNQLYADIGEKIKDEINPNSQIG